MISSNNKPAHSSIDKIILVDDDTDNLSSEELAQIFARRAYKLAQKPDVEAIGQTLDLLVFRLAGERYGIRVQNVQEIYPLEQLTRVPRTPNFIVGVFSARGRILSVVDLHAFLGLSPLERGVTSKIIVVTNTNPASEMVNMEVGILADEVEDVRTIFKDDLSRSLITRSDTISDYTQGITNDLIEVLDLDILLDDKRLIINDEI